MSATYLLRFDDICPAMNWAVWDQVERILAEAGVRPLLAVVPDNRDPHLNVAAPDPAFWNKVRAWKQRGWAIGLHGFQHRYTSSSAGIIGRNRYSEFAGLTEREQRRKLEAALAIFSEQGIQPDAWIAPAHSFDHTTVRLLVELGVDCISDGYSLHPFVCRQGLLWIPQQLGRFLPLPLGDWTVCLHTNFWSAQDICELRTAVAHFRERITCLDQLRDRYTSRQRDWADYLFLNCFRAVRSLRG